MTSLASILKEKRKSFANELVYNVALAHAELEEQYTQARQGNVLVGHFIGLAQTFTTDSAVLLEALKEYDKRIAAAAAMAKPNVSRLTRVVDRNPGNTRSALSGTSSDTGCRTCGKAKEQSASVRASKEAAEDWGFTPKTTDDVLKEFGGDLESLQEFTKAYGIDVGKCKTPDCIAAKILEAHEAKN